MGQEKKLLALIFLILFLLMAPKINAKTCCTRYVTVDISGYAMEANLARALWVSLFSGEGGSLLDQCPALIVGAGGRMDYQFKGVLFSGPAGRLDMTLIDCVHNTVVKFGSITWPCVSFPNSCIAITINFITSFAAYFQPLDKIIFDYERIPEHCEIEVEQEEVFPGQEIQVKLSDITNAEGRKSREFNQIVVSASKGEIIGGTELYSDPKFKAFRVGEGSITFTYKAPDEENSQATEDKIIVYNSCDILKKDEYPMPKTGLKDKIAEKKIKLIRANYATAKITEKYEVIGEEGVGKMLNSKLNVVLKYSHTESSVEYYDTVSWDVHGTGSILYGMFKKPRMEKSNKIPEKLLIFFDSKTGKATHIVFPCYEYYFIFDTPYGIFRYEQIGVTDSAIYVKGGDGIHEMEGSGTDVLNSACRLKFTAKWNIKRYRNK